jgi:hypothetical protein
MRPKLVERRCFNPLNAELNPICHLLTLLGGATIVVLSRLRVNRHRNLFVLMVIIYTANKLVRVRRAVIEITVP